jgi:hypothetical protein
MVVESQDQAQQMPNGGFDGRHWFTELQFIDQLSAQDSRFNDRYQPFSELVEMFDHGDYRPKCSVLTLVRLFSFEEFDAFILTS